MTTQLEFTTREVSSLTGLPMPTLAKWAAKGAIVPLRRGPKGRSHGHRWSTWKAVVLAMIACYRREMGDDHLPTGLVRRLYATFDNLTDDDMRQCLFPDAYEEERLAAREGLRKLMPPVWQIPEEWWPTINLVLDAIRLKMNNGRPRPQPGFVNERGRDATPTGQA